MQAPLIVQPFSYQCQELTEDLALWEMSGRPTAAQWAQLMRDAQHWLLEQESRGRTWGIVVDPSGLPTVTTSMRRSVAKWRAEQMPLIANTCACASYVASSTVIRSAVSAIFWIAQPVVPVSVKGSREEAVDWVEQRLGSGAIAAQ